MESEFDLDIELSLFAAALALIIFIMHNSLLLSHYISMYVAAGNHKHGFLCEVQGFLWSYMGFYVE